MKRREFMRNLMAAGAGTFAATFYGDPFRPRMRFAHAQTGINTLVIVFQRGGADGLNECVPPRARRVLRHPPDDRDPAARQRRPRERDRPRRVLRGSTRRSGRSRACGTKTRSRSFPRVTIRTRRAHTSPGSRTSRAARTRTTATAGSTATSTGTHARLSCAPSGSARVCRTR